jgi:hypothetical protein
LQYGITSAGDNLTTGNGGLGGTHLIKNSVVLTLGGFTAEPDAAISSVYFQYGTDLTEPRIPGVVPEPSSLILLAIGAVGLAAFGLRRGSAVARRL